MNIDLAFAALAAPALGALGAGGLALSDAHRRRRQLDGRLALVRVSPTIAARTEPPRQLGRAMIALVAPLLDPIFGIDRNVASDEAMSPVRPLLTGVAVAIAVQLTATALFGAGVALGLAAGGLAGLQAARMAVAGKRDRVRRRMEDEFAAALGVIIRCVRAGLPVTEGMRAVAAEVPAPTGPEFRRCVDQIQLGEEFDAALVKLAERCAIADYRFFATSVTLQRQTGGNLSETLDNLADTVRKRKAVRLKAQALTSETRATVLVLAVLPLAVGALLMVVNPPYVMQLFTTSSGKTLLGSAIAIQAVGLFIIRAITRRNLA